MKKVKISKFQKQFWLLNNLATTNPTYNIPSVFKLDKKPDVKILQETINVLIHRHESLRTSFKMENDEVYQYVEPAQSIDYRLEEITCNKPFSHSIDEVPSEIYDEIHKPFSLDSSPLLRIKLFNFNDAYCLTIVFHHIIIDLHSKNVFANEFSAIYNAKIKGVDLDFPELTLHYSDYANWHNEWEQTNEGLKKTATWLEEIPDPNTLLNLPLDFDRPKLPNFNGERIYFSLGNALSSKVFENSIKQSSTVFVVLLTAYTILLQKLSQQDSIVIGVPLSNRKNEEFKDIIGCFVNIVPIVVDFSGHPTYHELRTQIRQKLLFAHRKQEISFLELLNSTKGKRNPSYTPFFQAGFTFEPPMQLQLEEILAENVVVKKQGAQLDVFLTMWKTDNLYNGFFEFATDLFLPDTGVRFKDCYIQTANQIVEANVAISQLSILPENDKEYLNTWNNTDNEVDTNICLHQKLEQQVKINPHNVAVTDGNHRLTYQEFNAHVNRLSHHIIVKGINIEDIIAVCLNRSMELMVAIYAIHKSGGAYLPLDPNYPCERLSMIVEDAKPKFIITTTKEGKNLEYDTNCIYIDNILTSPLSANDKNPSVSVSSNNLAYLIYTSGSTGRPKGVMIEHKAVINKLEWMQQQHPINNTDTLLLKTPFTFDVSVWELFWWNFNGSKLCLLPVNGEKDPKTIADYTYKEKVTTIIFVPSMFEPFVEYVQTKLIVSKLNTLKYIVQIGEALSPQLVNNFNKLRSAGFSPLLVNTYGPTEATVAVSYYNCPEKNPVHKMYIGKPIYNTKLFTIDKDRNIQPIGVPGELVISGSNLSRGYLNRPELNEEKFISIKDLDGKSLRAYRTGDLVKWNTNGELDFIGRVDNQVKVRGYRIELGDIEAKLLEHKHVRTAAVIVNTKSNSQLVGYVVLENGANFSQDEIKKYLFVKLPDYMVPSQIVLLEKMPLNTSGKIDRKSLPEPGLYFENDVIEPSTNFEKKLSETWCKLLNLKSIGINSNFFDIGGNSLMAIRMVSEIKNKLMVDIEPLTLMQYPNIKELAAYLSSSNKNGEESTKSEIRMNKRDFSRFKRKRHN
ncbi:non-ribosomal peptide synthetase [Saccharicrinis sp. GN24d3]|uniref:non-ribosomal peptide synthetase n=1 Tax=Saccharicrinis sp. GN24d3 TaxID=3458416 RepID=UPI004035421F